MLDRLGKMILDDGPIGTAAISETGFHLVSLNLILHSIEKTLSTALDMDEAHLEGARAGRFFFDAPADALADEKGNAGDGLLGFIGPFHNPSPHIPFE